jgi:hypothetical protein
MIAFGALSVLADADVVAFRLGIPYSAPFGHRGFSNARFFATWRPIPVSPIGARMLSSRGLHVLLIETLWSSPLLVWSLWPRRAKSLVATGKRT